MYQQMKNERGLVPNVVKRLSDGAFIFEEPTSQDYQQYLKWLEEGNEPLPPDEPQQGAAQ